MTVITFDDDFAFDFKRGTEGSHFAGSYLLTWWLLMDHNEQHG